MRPNRSGSAITGGLLGLRKKLGDMPRRAIDEDDVVQRAFNSFLQRAAVGQFPRLTDRDDLWHLLVAITAHKALNQRVHQGCLKRGAGKVLDQAALEGADGSDRGLGAIIGSEPSPEFAAQVAEQLERVMDELPDPNHRVIVLWKLEGRINPEIARHLDCSLSAVERQVEVDS